jgi:hypothetical protein
MLNGFKLVVTEEAFLYELLDFLSGRISKKMLGDGYVRILGRAMQKSAREKLRRNLRK